MRALPPVAAVLILLSPVLAAAQAPPATDELPRIRITDPNRDLFRLALPNIVGEGPLAQEALGDPAARLEIFGLFNLLNPTSFPPDLQREGMGFSSALWSATWAPRGWSSCGWLAKAAACARGAGLPDRAGARRALLSRTYQGPSAAPAAAHLDQRRHRAVHRPAGGVRLAHRLRHERPAARDRQRGGGRLGEQDHHQHGGRVPDAGLFAGRQPAGLHLLPARNARPLGHAGGGRPGPDAVAAARHEQRRRLVCATAATCC